MTYTENESLSNFHFWSGGADTAKVLTIAQLEALDDLLPEAMDWNDTDSIPSSCQINDLFWFEDDFIARLLGFPNFAALEAENESDS